MDLYKKGSYQVRRLLEELAPTITSNYSYNMNKMGSTKDKDYAGLGTWRCTSSYMECVNKSNLSFSPRYDGFRYSRNVLISKMVDYLSGLLVPQDGGGAG